MRKAILAIVIAVLVAVVGLAGWAYIQNKDAREAGKFIKGTVINGVDCGNLNVNQSAEKIAKAWNEREYVITKGGKEIASISGFDFEYDIKRNISKCVSSEPLKAILTYYGLAKNEKSIEMPIVKQTKQFKRQVRKLKLPVTGKRIRTRNAYIDMSTREYKIVPEVYGNTLSRKMLRERIVSDIEKDVFNLEYVEKDFYKQPKICKDNNKLLKKQKYYKKYLGATIIWNLRYTKLELTPKQMDDMIDIKNGSVEINEDAVTDFVNGMVYTAESEYNAYRGTSGKSLNVAGSIQGLVKALASGKDTTVKAQYTGGTSGPLDKTSTYVEIDISSQHMWLYSKGKVKLESPIVTGDVKHHDDTPTGTYYIFNKKSPAVLKGKNYDGTKYKSKVSYWMPFNGGIGLHDAPWKSVFGGKEYLYNGSHGCINLPPKVAKSLYSKVVIGTKVVVHQ